MHKLLLMLCTVSFPCFALHHPHHPPTTRQSQINQIDSKKIAAHRAREVKDTKKQQSLPQILCNYTQFADDEVFAATGLPKEMQRIIKDYSESTVKFFPAFTFKRVIPSGWLRIMLSEDHLATCKTFTTPHHQISVWDTRTGERIKQLACVGPVRQLMATIDGLLLVFMASGSMHVWKPLTGERLSTISTMHREAILLGDKLALRGVLNTITMWDVKTGKEEQTITVPSDLTDEIVEMHPLPNHEILIRPVHDNLIVWNPTTGFRKLNKALMPHNGLRKMRNGCLVIRSDAAVSTKIKNTVQLYDPVKEAVLMETIKDDAGLHISANEHTVAMLDSSGLEIWDSISRKIMKDPAIHSKLSGILNHFLWIQLLPNGHCLFQDNWLNIYLYDISEGQLVKIQNRTFAERYSLISTDGTAMLVDPEDNHEISYLFTQEPEAHAAWRNLTTAQLILLEKLIDQLNKKPGIRGALAQDKPMLLTDETVDNFFQLPAPIQKCLKSHYRLTAIDTEDMGGQSCVIL